MYVLRDMTERINRRQIFSRFSSRFAGRRARAEGGGGASHCGELLNDSAGTVRSINRCYKGEIIEKKQSVAGITFDASDICTAI